MTNFSITNVFMLRLDHILILGTCVCILYASILWYVILQWGLYGARMSVLGHRDSSYKVHNSMYNHLFSKDLNLTRYSELNA